MSDQVRIKLKVSKLLHGSVMPAGEVVLVSQRTAQQWINAKDAEAADENAPRSIASRRQKAEKEEPSDETE